MNTDYERIEASIRYLEAHHRQQPTLAEVAAHVHLSVPHFERLFKRWAGVSPKRFLQYLTLEHAKSLLSHSRSVLDVAFEAGLSSPSRLHDLFVTLDAVTPGEFKQAGTDLVIQYGFHPTHFGSCFLARTERGICRMTFNPPAARDIELDHLRRAWPKADLVEAPSATAPLVDRILNSASANGHEPLSLFVRGTNFQVQVWQALLRIPAGHVTNYQDLAGYVGRPAATRAVASAVARNPVGVIIPCHRVIRKNGETGQYHWGSTRKKALLGWEMAQKETP